MLRFSRLIALSVIVVLSLALVNVANARGILSTTSTIEARVTGVNTMSDPPMLSVTTDKGIGYLLRATDESSITSARTGSRIRATGSLMDGVFLATSVEKITAARSVSASVAMQNTVVVGVIVQMNTAANPPQVIIDTGSGALTLVTLPGASRVADLQIGASITATGTLANNNLTATSFTIIGGPQNESGDDDDDDDDNNENSNDDDDDDDDDNNENANDGGDDDDNNENANDGGDDDDNNENANDGGDDDDDDGDDDDDDDDDDDGDDDDDDDDD